MSIFTARAPRSLHVLAAQAPHQDGPGAFSWWPGERHDHAQAGAALVSLLDLVDAVRTQHSLSQAPLLACGFSQGAALTSLLLQSRPGLLASAALLCGYVVETPTVVDLAKTPVLIVHGSRDPVIPIESARQGAHYLEDRNAEVTFIEENTRHKVGAAGMRGFKAWLQRF